MAKLNVSGVNSRRTTTTTPAPVRQEKTNMNTNLQLLNRRDSSSSMFSETLNQSTSGDFSGFEIFIPLLVTRILYTSSTF